MRYVVPLLAKTGKLCTEIYHKWPDDPNDRRRAACGMVVQTHSDLITTTRPKGRRLCKNCKRAKG